MPYYHGGDYYRGDYYRGGDIFGILKKVVGGVSKVASFVPGPIGAIGKAVNTALTVGKAVQAVQQITAPGGTTVVPHHGGAVTMDAGNFPVSISIPRAPISENYDTMIPAYQNTRRPGDTGRVGHFKKDGTWTNRARPRMNVTNVRALRKAGRRVRGFLKMASKLGALPVSRSAKGKIIKRKRK